MYALLRTFSWQELRHHPWRNAAAVAAVMLGVALAFSVHLINASALSEFSSAVRAAGVGPCASKTTLQWVVVNAPPPYCELGPVRLPEA